MKSGGVIPPGIPFMIDRAFVDTNILVYSKDTSHPEKHARAVDLMESLWTSRCGRISVQVLNEYFVTLTRKLRPGLSPETAWASVQSLRAWDPIATDWRMMELARSIQARRSVSWWDALIIAAAQMTQCDILLSEDLQHDEHYGDVRVVNPFV